MQTRPQPKSSLSPAKKAGAKRISEEAQVDWNEPRPRIREPYILKVWNYSKTVQEIWECWPQKKAVKLYHDQEQLTVPHTLQLSQPDQKAIKSILKTEHDDQLQVDSRVEEE